MNGLIVKGRFIGNTSCGFVTNHEYTVKICRCRCVRPFFNTKADNWLWVFDMHSGARCPYASIKLLADNWEIPVKQEGDREIPVSNRIWDG